MPGILPPLASGAAPNRRSLAAWLFDPAHPLTARVTVNRYWQLFFGTGLVTTPEDFGSQGDKPSHPDLLDWLALEFSNGWDVKALHRQIVTSAAYRQSAKLRPGLFERDPKNRLLARGPRRRMPSWMIRDQALALGGLLSPKFGGPSVKPYQPTGVWAEATFGKKRYSQGKGEDLYRRSLYTYWRRIIGPTMFFDTSKRQTCSVKTTLTNTPLHALATLNDVTYVESGRALAERLLKLPASASTNDLVRMAFQHCTSRSPNREEERILTERFLALETHYRAAPGEANALLSEGASPRDVKLDATRHAALAGICRLLFNLDEVLNN